ncbi:MAG: glucose-6-phosphate isomerase [Desulfobacteraceae bacterium]|nr:glucose-6-phosphate isomerase [Desulfobacteraceae bacterium]
MYPHSLDNKLFRHSFNFTNSDKVLKNLISDEKRFENFSKKGAEVFFDYSRQLIDSTSLELLYELASINGVKEKFLSMCRGEIVNKTEKREALHTLCRANESSHPLYSEIKRVKNEIKDYSLKIHEGKFLSSNGKRFENICVVGIGGSNLGTEFVITALSHREKYLNPFFISTCDPGEFFSFNKKAEIETTLFIIISKSYTTREVMINESLIINELIKNNLDPKKHIVRITAKDSPGDLPEFKVFHMFDSIGGRYSVSSAVGGLPISLVYGFDVFEEFLNGMHEMDDYCKNSDIKENICLKAALIDIWNSVYLDLPALAIIPYSSYLEKLHFHIQQLYMESNGKKISENNDFLNYNTSMIIFGETGSKAQHSFFQLFHQGRSIPVEFIGVLSCPHKDFFHYQNLSGNDELFANLLAQADVLAAGRDENSPQKKCLGNRPSSIITINNLNPDSIGRLVSFYEARTVMAGFLWNINPFDQFGVEAGKILANEKREVLKKALNHNIFPENNKSDNYYARALASGKNI